jgi:type IV fimbrial biogenesis protein FimT
MPNLQRGVTLIELLVVVAIMAILAALAAPSFSSLVNSMRLTSTYNQLLADLNHARSEAIKRNTHVWACIRSNDANGNASTCANGTNWAAGWIVCADNDRDGACSATEIIDVRPATGGTLTVMGNSNLVNFNPNASASALTLTLTSSSVTRTLSVQQTGNILSSQ